jgi:hypothetical protein
MLGGLYIKVEIWVVWFAARCLGVDFVRAVGFRFIGSSAFGVISDGKQDVIWIGLQNQDSKIWSCLKSRSSRNIITKAGKTTVDIVIIADLSAYDTFCLALRPVPSSNPHPAGQTCLISVFI